MSAALLLVIFVLSLLAVPCSTLTAPGGPVEVYRLWESMADPPAIKIDLLPDWEVDDVLEKIEKEFRTADPHAGDWEVAVVSIVTREGSDIEFLSQMPANRKVFVLCGSESFFFPTDNIGEVFDVELPHSSKTVQAKVVSNTPRLLMIENFLSDAECDRLVAAAKPMMTRSTVELSAKDGKAKEHHERTSSTAWLSDDADEFVPSLHERVEDLVKVPKSFSESLQARNHPHHPHHIRHLGAHIP